MATGSSTFPGYGGREWTLDYRRLVGRLATLQSWLPASAWADVEATIWLPVRYAICIDSTERLEPSDVVPLVPGRSRCTSQHRPAVGRHS